MAVVDEQYKRVIDAILRVGVWDKNENVRTEWADGSAAYTKSWMGQFFLFDNSEIPILTSKYVGWKTAIKELLWIWQMKSNRVQDLRDMGVNIWNEWELEDGTIGKAYGYQLGKKNRLLVEEIEVNGSIGNTKYLSFPHKHYVDQVDYLLHQLKHNPTSRRHITTLWNPDDLDDMSLTPCVYETQWIVKESKLHLFVRARSNDMALGNPFNIFQYNVLQRMVAQVTGYELGIYKFDIGDAHIYERHVDVLADQINGETFAAPQLIINPDVKDFYSFTIDDFELVDYKHGGKFNYEVAI